MSRPTRPALPARQQRSRETVEKLLDAAEGVLRDDGLDAATIENIAARARVSVGIVYRRFPDKDALLRATYERFFEVRAAANARALSSELWFGKTAVEIVAAFVKGAVAGAARERQLVASLNRFAAMHDDAAFRRYASSVNRDTHARLSDLLLKALTSAEAGRIGDRIPVAVDVLLFTLRGYLIEQNPAGGHIPPKAALIGELTSLVTGYLALNSS